MKHQITEGGDKGRPRKYNPEWFLGRRFGLLLAISIDDKSSKGIPKKICVCDCGSRALTSLYALTYGTVSCGCLRGKRQTHGMTQGRPPRLYRIWANIKQRCGNIKCPRFKDYGGRGIYICDEWKSSFVRFYEWALQNGYGDHLTIDRIDNDKGYYPENCRWSTDIEQKKNRRKNIIHKLKQLKTK